MSDQSFCLSLEINSIPTLDVDDPVADLDVAYIGGPQGKAATISIGGVQTLPSDAMPTVENTGTENAAVLEFGIPLPDEAFIRQVAGDQDTVLIYDFDAIVASNLGI